MKKERHWSEKLAVDQGEILLRWLLYGEKSAQKETETMTKLLLEMDVKPGMEVLDVCCGYGRRAVRLAEKGFKVMGVDLSEVNINYAKRLAEERKVSDCVGFLVGDARRVGDLLRQEKERFNGIVGILPAIGYYDEETDENMLAQLYQLARPEGVLILNVANRDYHVERFKFLKETLAGSPAYEIHHTYRFDYEKSRRREIWKIYEVDGRNLEHVSAIDVNRRLYCLQN